MKKYKNYVLAFLFPFIICILVLGFKGVLNNVESIYVSDLSGQHLPFLSYLKGIMLGRESLAYSYYAGMGSPMLATMIFYCVSPFNILLLLISDIQYAILFITIGKVSLAGLTMYIYLKNKFRKDNFVGVLFSTCYAVSSFSINFWFCGFWFDSLYLAPLVMLGIEKMYKYEKINYLYIFSLALAIICNIQMGFGLCVYSVIYFLYSFCIRYRVSNFKKFRKLLFIFIISSLCAGGISSGILLGFLSQYDNIVSARRSNSSVSFFASNVFYIIKNLFSVGRVGKFSYNEYEPYIYCGLVITYFSCIYFFNSKISKRKKICSFIVILVFIISFCINPINIFWHISVPVLLNYRYSYCLSLFLINISYECFMKRSRLKKEHIKKLYIISGIALFILMIFLDKINILECGIFILFILVFIILSRTKGKRYENYLFVIIVIEIFVSAYTSIKTDFDIEPDVVPKYTSYKSLKELASKNHFEDGYRVMYDYDYADRTNEGFLINKNSDLRYFSSVISGNVIDFFSRNQSYVGWNNYRVSAYESPILLSLLGNKYFYLPEEFDNGLYKKIDKYKVRSYDYSVGREVDRDIYLYENPYALSVGYMIYKDASYKKEYSLVEYQNQIMQNFTNNYKNVAELVDVEIELDSSECVEDGNDNCVIYHLKNSNDSSNMYIYRIMDSWFFSKDYHIYYDTTNIFFMSTGDKNIDMKVLSDFKNYPPGFIVVSTFNTDKLISNLEILRENMLYDIDVNKNVMTGYIDASRDGILFLSIPYDDRFKVYVDGKSVKYYSLLDDSFMGLDIKSGKHEIELVYDDSDNYKWYILSSSIFIVITFVVKYFINRLFDKS